VSDEKLWDESPTSRHLQVLYHQTSFQTPLPCLGRTGKFKMYKKNVLFVYV